MATNQALSGRTEPNGAEGLTLFERHVKEALRLFEQPERIGALSPLATPYVLASAVRELPHPVDARAWGELLCIELRAAAAQLWGGPLPATRDEMLAAIAVARRDPDDPRYTYAVLELRCFHDYITPRRTSDIWEQPELLPGSKSQHYRDWDAAIERLAALLLDRLRPALRPERPRAPAELIGYERQLAQLVDAMERGSTVSLSGAGGVGKTSIAATVVERLGDRPAFWYTLRPGFNDGANSLLIALGAFLHGHGATGLWRYMLAATGDPGELGLAAGLLRQDIASLSPLRPLICIDDLEHVSGAQLLLKPEHVQLLDLIDSLRGTTSLLLIGQRSIGCADLFIELGGLDVAGVARLWRAGADGISPAEAERLHAYTGGNPRLLSLIQALHADCGAADGPGRPELLAAGDAVPSLLPAFQRLWRRLAPPERRALQRLSVYRSHAPEEIVEPETIGALLRLRLIERDGAGGITLLPALAPIVHDDISPEVRELLHGQAARVRLERGEYTAAAHHFVAADQENLAVQVWFPQRQRAIARGEADAARLCFGNISRQRLDPPERKALDVIRAELRRRAGENEAGLRELEQADWSADSETSAHLWMLRGEMQDALGFPDQALASYDDGLRVTARLLGQSVSLYHRRGILYKNRRDLKASWQESERGEFDLQLLRGLVRVAESDYDTALHAYTRARELADRLDDDTRRAQAERWISALYGRRQQLGQAVFHAERAIAIYDRLGDRVNLQKMRGNLAFIYVQTKQFRAALEVGVPAYEFFLATSHPYDAACAAANLAEASFELGAIEDAERFAGQVLELGERFAAPYAHFTLGQVALARCETGPAISSFGRSMQLAEANQDSFMAAYARRALGKAYGDASDGDTAEQLIAQALELFRRLDLPAEVAATEQLLNGVAAYSMA